MSKNTALIICDVQNAIIKFVPQEHVAPLINHTKQALKFARDKGLHVIFVRVAFNKGAPEISPNNKSFSAFKNMGVCIIGDEGAELAPELERRENELIITKVRVGAFSTTNLRHLLQSLSVDSIVLGGISTSGVILTSVREAADLDFKVTVLKDCCADRTENVHKVLLEEVFTKQGDVLTVEEWTKTFN